MTGPARRAHCTHNKLNASLLRRLGGVPAGFKFVYLQVCSDVNRARASSLECCSLPAYIYERGSAAG